MLFHSTTFALFFAVVFPLYCVLSHRFQNRWLLGASLVFYGWWDWRFLALMVAAASLDFVAALIIHGTDDEHVRRRWLMVSLVGNLGTLAFFKYFNFFVESFQASLGWLGVSASSSTLSIVLPIGISFYTFQALSYTIDVYRRQLTPVRNYADYLLFVTFFPQLVAGPIERATTLLPQILGPRRITWDHLSTGAWLIVLGLFKKTAIADLAASVADPVFAQPELHSSAALWLGVYAFALQIYADFSGYSDMARGLARMMGFELMVNFEQPYFAASVTEFWRRWHISLSTWLKDYLYVPLGGNRCGQAKTYRNLMITMLLGGLWHGASWNFVIWGGLHGLYLALHRILREGVELLRRLVVPPHSGSAEIYQFPQEGPPPPVSRAA